MLRGGRVFATMFFIVLVVGAVARRLDPEHATVHAAAAAEGDHPIATFSILACDPKTGELGGAVQSRVFAVGNGVLWAEAGVGAVATQSYADVSYGPRGLELLRDGLEPRAVIERLLEEDPDPQPERWPEAGRQVAVLDAKGRAAAHTGERASEARGHRVGENFSVQGNLLASEEVLDAMAEAFEASAGHLSQRMMAALEAGQLAGGDRRGMQSAALLVALEDGGPWLHNDNVLRLQVDDSDDPLVELRRLVDRTVRERRLGQ